MEFPSRNAGEGGPGERNSTVTLDINMIFSHLTELKMLVRKF
jgi:hypothetical protein